MAPSLVLVTGATGHVGSHLIPVLLAEGYRVRVLSRNPRRLDPEWRDQVQVVEGDATRRSDLDRALADVDVAYHLMHSMDGRGGFVDRDRALATVFSAAAEAAGVGRMVYLSGLHPDGELSTHLASRVEVGEILLQSAVPAAVLQAGIVLGGGSASFQMLRHLTERLPIAVGPRWLKNRVQPIAIADVVHYLVRAASLGPEKNRTYDVGMNESLTYVQMMKRYASTNGLMPRFMFIVPVLTPGLASHWVGLVTPVPAGVAKPLVGSLIHDAVVGERDASRDLGDPPGGTTGFEDAVRIAGEGSDAHRWGRISRRVAAGVVAAAGIGSLLTTPNSAWYRRVRKPAWQPPPVTFPLVWTGLYGLIWAAASSTIAELIEDDQPEQADAFGRALALNLVLNAAWSGVFFRAHRLRLATVTAAVLAVSSADLTRRAAASRRANAVALAPYVAWTAFAAVLSSALARRNRGQR